MRLVSTTTYGLSAPSKGEEGTQGGGDGDGDEVVEENG